MSKVIIAALAAALVFAIAGCMGDPNRRPNESLPASGSPVALQPLAANAPQDKPTMIDLEMHNKILAMSREARKALPEIERRFHKGLPQGQTLFVITELHDAQGKRENVFVQVVKWQNGIIHGAVATTTNTVTKVKPGDRLTISEDDVLDWSISRADGTEEGNVIGKYLDTVGR